MFSLDLGENNDHDMHTTFSFDHKKYKQLEWWMFDRIYKDIRAWHKADLFRLASDPRGFRKTITTVTSVKRSLMMRPENMFSFQLRMEKDY